MTGPEVLDVARDAIYTLIIVASPVMLVGLAVGVAISLLQALTQIQEMTLAFVPKILAIFISLLIALPFMAEKLHAEMLRIAARIVGGSAYPKWEPVFGSDHARKNVKCASTSHSCRCWPRPSC